MKKSRNRTMSKRNLHSKRSRSRLHKKQRSKRVLTRKQKKRGKKSFKQTLNQMGGFVRDGSVQFFKLLRDTK